MDHIALADLLAAPSRRGQPYGEVLRMEALSAGVYELRAGSDDHQKPHTEDEVYVVLRGRAQATVAAETVTVSTGDLLYVPAGHTHCFHEIEEDLVVLVVFAPPEGSASAGVVGVS